ncbi:MAG: zf-HC2 domain-containing protein [Thermoanaerobaculia bacterium]
MSETQPVAQCGFDGALLARFADGETSPAERRKVLRHLLSGCSSCRSVVAPKFRLISDNRPSEFSISRVLSNVAELEHQMNQERALAAEQFREFLRHPAARQWTLLRNSSRYDSWSFCELILDAGIEAIFDDPHLALDLCRMGVTIADRLGTGSYGERLVEDLRARAWGRTANSLRAISDLAGAEQALATAARHLKQGSGEPLEEAEHLYFAASLQRAQRHLDLALRTIHRSRRIYRMLGDRHLEGRAMMCESAIQDLRGESAESIDLCRRAIQQIDAGRNARLAFAVRHNLVWQLMAADRSQEALRELEVIRPLYAESGDRILLLKLRWMEARLAKDLGRPEESERAFREAHEGFVEARIPYEAASVALDLAVLLAEQGRRSELKLLAAELVAVFRSLGVAREAFVALTIFERLAQADAVTVTMLARLSQYFSRVRSQPDLRFDPNDS